MKLATTTGDYSAYTDSQIFALEHIRAAGFKYSDYSFELDYCRKNGIYSENAEKCVYNTRILEKSHPGVGSYKEVHPHGKHYEHNKYLLCFRLSLCNKVRYRICNNKAKYRCQKRKAYGTHKYFKIARLKKLCKIAEGKVTVLIRKRIVHYENKGSNNEQKRPNYMRRCRRLLNQ